MDRLAVSLATTADNLLPASEPADNLPALRERAKMLFEAIMTEGVRETLLVLTLLMPRLLESPAKRR